MSMATPQPEHVLKLASEMVSAQKHLAALQAEWDSLFSGVASTEPKVGRKANPEGVSSRILALLESKPDQVFDVASVQAELEGSDRKQVESALYNLFAAKKIKRPSRGKYQSKEGINDSFGF